MSPEQWIDVENRVTQIMTSPDVLRWPARDVLPLDHQPDVLVLHLVGAARRAGLGVPRVHDATPLIC
jgi:hypothetical protein